ncbi:MAG: DUF2207 domain-containing protein [Mollicutes bacterium]|nr:DUF2207 domain-containing protein [Mollicutes bacterium]
MKKKLRILVMVLFLMPLTVFAKDEGISNYFIEATVLPNGDLHVKELFVLEGEFSGYERIINYKNLDVPTFTDDVKSFEGSDIYNGSDIELIKIKAIEVDQNVNFDYLSKDGDEFVEAASASNGIYGQYVVTKTSENKSYKIYNPSTADKRGFYIEYIIKNLAVLHNDVAEIYWNIFSGEQQEFIENLEMIVNIPNNQEEVSVWGHGVLNGETEILNKSKLLFKVNDLSDETAIDIRFIFDKSVIFESTKVSNVDALEKILVVEQKRADEANEIREWAKKVEKRIKILSIIFDTLKVFWIGGLLYILYTTYHKHDKEYQTTFKTKYFRDFPADYGPYCVGYLMNKKIGPKEFSATILDLIERKHIKYEKIKKKEYQLLKNTEKPKDKLTKSENKVMQILFETIGKNGKVTIREINKYAKKHYQSFLNEYEDWKDLALIEAEKQNFYEEKGEVQLKIGIYIVLGLVFIIFTFPYSFKWYISILSFLLGVVSLIYIINIKKRTKQGQEQYVRWIGLKRFINDFGKFEARDLPQIHLWEKYLVYAAVFGIAKKLAKNMEVRFKEMPTSEYTVGDFVFDVAYIRMINNINYSISHGVTNAVSTAMSTKAISETKPSSGGGFGGGFSGGGGFGGGGGGGGRF